MTNLIKILEFKSQVKTMTQNITSVIRTFYLLLKNNNNNKILLSKSTYIDIEIKTKKIY